MSASKNFRLFAVLFFFFLLPNISSAHCDSMEGPVVKASKQALESGNINYALIWVKPENEQEIRTLFEKVLHVRTLNNEAKELADNYFFETIVRVHRMGEGESYTGIKPVGYKPEKGIEEADLAIQNNSIDNLLSGLNKDSHSEVVSLFKNVQSKKNYQVNDLKAGREYVDSYVQFIHHIESLYAGKEGKSEHQHD